jgi:hypothetical protein
MTPRLAFIAVVLLSQTGCVAAIPLAAQLMSSPNASAQLCSMTKLPGQTSNLCERMPFASATPATKAPVTASVSTVTR